MSGALDEKHALVTGGARGIGAAITRELLRHGAHVTIVGRDCAALEKAAALSPGKIDCAIADVSDQESVVSAFKTVIDRNGRVDILVNNAGQAKSAPFLKTDPAVWRELMAVNIDGAFHCTQAALPGMLEASWGRVVNIASAAGLTGYRYVSAYCASKHALIGLTRSLALEFSTKGITVNAVCPGYTDTDMTKEAVANITAKTGRSAEAAKAELAAQNPMKRFIRPEEVANAVLWLCLPGSEAITGQAIAVTGGEVK